MVKFPFVTDSMNSLDTWLQTHSVSVHKITRPDEWPAELKILTECIVDIPFHETNRFRDHRELKSISLFREELQITNQTRRGEGSSFESVLDITLSTVTTLEKLKTGSIVPIIPVVTGWLFAVAQYAGAGDAVFQDYDYALPRVSHPQQHPLLSLEPLHSKGILLLAHQVGNISNIPSVQSSLPPSCSQAILSYNLAEAYERGFNSLSCETSRDYDDFSGMKLQFFSDEDSLSGQSDADSASLSSSGGESSETSDVASFDSESSKASIHDGDTEAETKDSQDHTTNSFLNHLHFLARPTGDTYFLPTVCVALEEDIIPLVSSTLYHRRAWDMDYPVLGISVSPTTSFIRLVLGFLDTRSHDDGELPTVHIWTAGPCYFSDHTLGVFDLADEVSCLTFTQFLLNLNCHFRELLEAAASRKPKGDSALGWRADIIHPAMNCTGDYHDSIHYAIPPWIQANALSNQPLTIDSGPLFTAMTDSTGGPRYVHTCHCSPECDRPIRCPDICSISAPEDSVTFQTSDRSCSELAKIAPQGLGAYETTHNIDNWLFSRDVAKVLPVNGLSKEIDTVLETYNKVTRFEWPEKWVEIGELPVTGACSAAARKSLWASYEVDVNLNNYPRVGQASPEVTEAVEKKFSQLLVAVDGIKAQQATASICGTNESERRHWWDYIISHFLTSGRADTAWSSAVLLERQLNLAANKDIDRVMSMPYSGQEPPIANICKNICESQLARAESMSTLATELADRTIKSGLLGLFKASSEISIVAVHDRHDCAARTFKPVQAAAKLLERHRREPTTGTCNLIACLSVSSWMAEKLKAAHDDKGITKLKNVLSPFVFSKHPSQPEHHLVSIEKERKNTKKMKPTSSSTAPADSKEVPELPHRSFSTNLLLPILVAEYKVLDPEKVFSAMNQSLMYGVSAAIFLSRFGIKDYPVFLMTVDGVVGLLGMAWYSSDKDRVLLMEHGTTAFNILSPIGMYHFAITLVKISEQYKRLADLFDAKLNDSLKIEVNDETGWSQKHQVNKYHNSINELKKLVESSAVSEPESMQETDSDSEEST